MDVSNEVLAVGHVCLDRALPDSLLGALLEDAERYEFLPPGPNGGGHFAMGSMHDTGPAQFADWAQHRLSGSGFLPNEVSYQRYTSDAGGLRVHRDQRYYVRCIAIATLRGTATFGVHDPEPPYRPRVEWTTTPSDVVLLLGWLPPPLPDRRPFHRVDPPSTPDRLMVQLRMNAVAAGLPDDIEHLAPHELEQARRTAAFPQSQRRL